MGDWRRVHLVGTCDPADVPALRENIAFDLSAEDLSNFHSLSSGGGIAGLPIWAAPTINAVGNLAERNYDAEDVRNALERLAKIAPSLTVKAHLGDHYEADECVDTITLEGGKASVGPPEVESIPDIPESQMMANFERQMREQRGAKLRGLFGLD